MGIILQFLECLRQNPVKDESITPSFPEFQSIFPSKLSYPQSWRPLQASLRLVFVFHEQRVSYRIPLVGYTCMHSEYESAVKYSPVMGACESYSPTSVYLPVSRISYPPYLEL